MPKRHRSGDEEKWAACNARPARWARVASRVVDTTKKLADWLSHLVLRGPSGEARATLTFGEDGSPSLLIVIAPTKGKSREKVHVPKRFQPELADFATLALVDKALLELLAREYVGTGDGGLSLLIGTEIGPPMGNAFAVDEGRGLAWLGDWGFLRRVDLKTGLVTSIPLGDFPAVREVCVGKDGGVWILADRDTAKTDGPYRAPTGPKVTFGILRASGAEGGSLEIRHVVAVPRNAADHVCMCLSMSRDGSMLVPDEEGFAHLRPDTSLVRKYPCEPMKHGGAVAAISNNGRLIAVTGAEGRIDVHEVASGNVRALTLDMEDASSIAVHDDGTVDVGTRTPNHHFHRIPKKGPMKTVPDRAAHYTPSPDGAFVYAAQDGVLTRWTLEGEAVATWPVIGGSRGSPVFVGAKSLYVRTGRGVLMRIDLE
mgnify:CR=1 FL=1